MFFSRETKKENPTFNHPTHTQTHTHLRHIHLAASAKYVCRARNEQQETNQFGWLASAARARQKRIDSLDARNATQRIYRECPKALNAIKQIPNASENAFVAPVMGAEGCRILGHSWI